VTLASNVAVWASDLRELTNEERRALDDVELRRVERMPRPDRARSLLGAILIRRAAASALGCHPAEVPVSRRCSRGHTHHGRPVVTGADISLSLSHASRCLVVAVTSAASVGVDVEDEDPGGPMRWDLTLSEGELPSTCAGDRVRTWVRKEAVLKARGDGWDTPFAEVRLSAAADAPRLLSYRGEQLRASLHDLPLSGFLGAVAVLREGVGLDWRGQLDADLPPAS
jgi:4'-phosphopantetheinyl transferase